MPESVTTMLQQMQQERGTTEGRSVDRDRIRMALDLEDFCADPNRSVFVGRSFVFCCLDSVRGYRAWGQTTLGETRQLTACIAASIASTPQRPTRYSLVDLRAIEGIGASSFEAYVDFCRAQREQVASHMVRQAVVITSTSGLMGAICYGFDELATPRHPLNYFDSMDAAAKWLAPPDAGELDTLIAALNTGAAGFSSRLRRWLSANLVEPSPALAAKALGVSLRTMQRQLKGETTSFYRLLRAERVDAAQRLLRESGLKITTIAQEVGFASSQHLATSFKEVTGMTPSEFQSRQRRSAEGPTSAPQSS